MNDENITQREIQALSQHITDLIHMQIICKPGFEHEFWRSNVNPILFKLDTFVYNKSHQNTKTARECRTTVDAVMNRIKKFRSVYGIIKTIYKTLREIRDLLRGYELTINPESPKSLLNLSAIVVKKHKNLEAYLHQCSPNFPGEDFNYTYNNYFNYFVELELTKTHPTRKREFDNTLSTRISDSIKMINRNPILSDKIKIAKVFINRYEGMKTSTKRKELALEVFRGFVKTYRTYL